MDIEIYSNVRCPLVIGPTHLDVNAVQTEQPVSYGSHFSSLIVQFLMMPQKGLKLGSMGTNLETSLSDTHIELSRCQLKIDSYAFIPK